MLAPEGVGIPGYLRILSFNRSKSSSALPLFCLIAMAIARTESAEFPFKINAQRADAQSLLVGPNAQTHKQIIGGVRHGM
jgi:hypothetical protein